MTTRTLYLWEVYCTTTSTYQKVWLETEPTTCPVNSSHTISTNPGPKIIDEIKENKVRIIEEDGITQGLYKFEGHKITIPSGPSGNVTTRIHNWPFPITLMNGWFNSTNEHIDDEINVTVADGTIIGALQAPLYAGNSTMVVSSTVIDNIYLGYRLDVTDGVNLNDLGYIIDIDNGNAEVTMSESATNTFSPLSPTYVRLTVPVIENFHIPTQNNRYAFAEKKVGGKYIPANTDLCLHYTNNSGNVKALAYNIEILF